MPLAVVGIEVVQSVRMHLLIELQNQAAACSFAKPPSTHRHAAMPPVHVKAVQDVRVSLQCGTSWRFGCTGEHGQPGEGAEGEDAASAPAVACNHSALLNASKSAHCIEVAVCILCEAWPERMLQRERLCSPLLSYLCRTAGLQT